MYSAEEARFRMIARLLRFDDKRWITVKGTHVLLDNGVAVNGPFKGKEFPNAKSTEPKKSETVKTTGKRAKEIMNSIYDGILNHEGKQGDKKALSKLKKSVQGANDKEKLANLIKKVDAEYPKSAKNQIFGQNAREEIDAYRKGKDSFNSHEPAVYKNYEPITEEEAEKRRSASKARKEANAKKGLQTIGSKNDARTKEVTDYIATQFDPAKKDSYESFQNKCSIIDRKLDVGESIVYNSEVYTKVSDESGEGHWQKKDMRTGREIGNPVDLSSILYTAYWDKDTRSKYKGAEPFDARKYFTEQHPIEVYTGEAAKKYSNTTKKGKLKPPMPQREAREELKNLCMMYRQYFGDDNLQAVLNTAGGTLDDDDQISIPDDTDAIKGIARFYKYCNTNIPRQAGKDSDLSQKRLDRFFKGVECPVTKRCVEYEKKKHSKKKKDKDQNTKQVNTAPISLADTHLSLKEAITKYPEYKEAYIRDAICKEVSEADKNIQTSDPGPGMGYEWSPSQGRYVEVYGHYSHESGTFIGNPSSIDGEYQKGLPNDNSRKHAQESIAKAVNMLYYEYGKKCKEKKYSSIENIAKEIGISAEELMDVCGEDAFKGTNIKVHNDSAKKK